MRVLLTNHRLEDRAGSEMYLRDVASALRRRGHDPVVYSPFLGRSADDVRECAVPVVDDLSRVGPPPDLIHGQHHLPTVEALLRFPGVPAVFVCHGWLPWQEMPPRLSRVVRYVTVSNLTRQRLVIEEGIPSELIEVVPNFVDLERFSSRPNPLHPQPRRALVLSNRAVPGEGFHRSISMACAERAVDVDVLGLRSGRLPERPEKILADYDIVFARGRSALEAMAVGCSVVLCDAEGLGPMVTRGRVEELAAANFGFAVLTHKPRVESIGQLLDQYDPADAAEVQAWIRGNAGLEAALDRIEKVYAEAIADWSDDRAILAGSVEAAELGGYLHRLQTAVVPQVTREAEVQAHHSASHRVDAARTESRLLDQRLGAAHDAIEQFASKAEESANRAEASGRVAAALEAELTHLRDSGALRLQRWLRGRPILARVYRFVAGRLPGSRRG